MEFHGEGIYFGMPASEYHKHPYCGSSNIKQLYSSPPDFWFESPMNPLREDEEESFAQKFGTAIHDRILYGEEYFKKHYRFVTGEKGETVSAEGLKDWIVAQGGFPKKLKADNEKMVVQEMGTQLLTERIYQQIMISAALIVKNPNLSQAFTGGFPEVSIFWKEHGVPCKARIDYLKTKALVDLKSFRSREQIMTIDGLFISSIKRYKYHIQAAHYMAGHQAGAGLFAAGKVFTADGAARPDDTWLTKAFAGPANFVFVAYKADGAPISKSYQIPNKSPWHVDGASYVARALDNYRNNMERFGTDPWVNMDEPYALGEDDFKWVD